MRARPASGMTLIELLIGFVIVGVLLALGVPSFSAWLQNMQVRNAAESIFNGLQLARTNAVQRNKSVTFTMNGPDSSWSVTIDTPSIPLGEPATVQSHSGAEGTRNAVIATTSPTISFSGLGAANPATTIQVTNPTGGACQTAVAGVGTMRCLNITVSAGGQIKMCDPIITANGDSRKC